MIKTLQLQKEWNEAKESEDEVTLVNVQSQIEMKLPSLESTWEIFFLEEAEAYRSEGHMGLVLVDSNQITEERT